MFVEYFRIIIYAGNNSSIDNSKNSNNIPGKKCLNNSRENLWRRKKEKKRKSHKRSFFLPPPLFTIKGIIKGFNIIISQKRLFPRVYTKDTINVAAWNSSRL